MGWFCVSAGRRTTLSALVHPKEDGEVLEGDVTNGGRSRLATPVAFALTAMWLITGLRAAVTGEIEAFVVASGPFGILCGYLYGMGIGRTASKGVD